MWLVYARGWQDGWMWGLGLISSMSFKSTLFLYDVVNELGQLLWSHPEQRSSNSGIFTQSLEHFLAVWCETFAVTLHQTVHWYRVVRVYVFCSLDNISTYPVKRNAPTPAASKKKTKIFAVASDALRRLLFTLSPLQTGGCVWIPGPTSLSQLLKLTLTSGLALTLLNPQAPLCYWGWRFIRGDGHSHVSVPSSGGPGLFFFSFPWGVELKCCSASWPRVWRVEPRVTDGQKLLVCLSLKTSFHIIILLSLGSTEGLKCCWLA